MINVMTVITRNELEVENLKKKESVGEGYKPNQ
jgi:hypothetical protein